MLEALKSSEATRLKDRPFFEDTFEHVPSADAPPAVDDGIPFIEVGPNKKVEGSTQVMAFKHPAQTRMQPPHQPAEKIAQIQPMHAELQSAKPLGVAFEPWPALPRLGQGIAPEIITFHHPEHAVSKQYAALIARMQGGPSSTQPRVVLFTGCRSQVGTSTVLLNLAVAAAQQGNGKVVVVDAQLRHPSLAQRLGYVSAAGLQDVLQGKLALEQAVVQTTITGLYLVPAQPSAAAVPLRAEAVRWLFSWLGEHFNLILVDGPSLETGSDLTVLAAACDGAYLVLPEGEEPQSQRSLAQTVTAMGARLRGLFHTRSDS